MGTQSGGKSSFPWSLFILFDYQSCHAALSIPSHVESVLTFHPFVCLWCIRPAAHCVNWYHRGLFLQLGILYFNGRGLSLSCVKWALTFQRKGILIQNLTKQGSSFCNGAALYGKFKLKIENFRYWI